MTGMDWLETWRAADRAAASTLARARAGEAETEEARRLRELAGALFRQATAAMRVKAPAARTVPRLGYDEMWDLVLDARCRTHVGHAAMRRAVAA